MGWVVVVQVGVDYVVVGCLQWIEEGVLGVYVVWLVMQQDYGGGFWWVIGFKVDVQCVGFDECQVIVLWYVGWFFFVICCCWYQLDNVIFSDI